MLIDIKSTSQVTYLVKRAVTILNKNGDDEGDIQLWYNKSRQIRSMKGVVYNEFGIVTAKFSDKDFVDESSVSDYSLFDDSRIKHFHPPVNAYPYTVEYEYEIRSKQTLSLPDWYPNSSEGVAVEKAVLKVQAVAGFMIRYREINFPGKVLTGINSEKQRTWTWSVSNQGAIRVEPLSPDPATILTSVQLASEKFSYDNVTGSFNTWSDFGNWMSDALLTNRNAIPFETSNYILELTKDLPEPKEKAKKIYEFLQQKTRYVSIQVGIGGFQPMLASEVDRLGYGDCKGLVNYMQGLLRVAGINSWYTIVEAGELKKSADPGFPGINFGNHVILCIPFERDTTWLECTSKQAPFGFLGDFTDDRLVIACTPEGGKLMRTPVYTAELNLEAREADFKIAADGTISGTVKTTFSGVSYDSRESLFSLSQNEQMKKLPDIYTLNNLQVISYKLSKESLPIPVTNELLELKASGYAAINGNRMYLPLNELNRMTKSVREVRNRTNPVYINRGYTNIDEFIYQLPTGYLPEGLPDKTSIEFPFGTFSSSVSLIDERLIYTRKLQIKQGTYPASEYEQLVNFYQKAIDADNRKIILLKK